MPTRALKSNLRMQRLILHEDWLEMALPRRCHSVQKLGFFAELGLTTVVIGPGDMAHDGHKPDEGLSKSELTICDEMMGSILAELRSSMKKQPELSATSPFIQKTIAVIALVFGTLTLFSGGNVLFGPDATQAWAENYVGFDRKNDILKATLDLAFEVGPDHVTTGLIAGRLGLSQPAIYKHFRKKEDIWKAATETLCAQIRQNTLAANSPTASAIETLRRLISGHLRLTAATPALPEIMTTRDPTDTLTQARNAIQAEVTRFRAALVHAYEAGQSSGVLRASLSAADGVTLLFGIIQSLVLRLIVSRDPASLLDDGARLLDLQIGLIMTWTMNKVFKLSLITLPIAAIGVGILAFVVSNSAPPTRIELAERAHAVRVVTAQTTDIVPNAVGFGLVTPARSFAAIAEVSGTVEYLHPDLRDGQILLAGAVLLRLAPARLAELDVAESNQRAALEIKQEALAVKASDLARAEALFTAGTMTQTARDAVRAAHLVQRQKAQSAQSALALIPTQREVQAEQVAIYQTTLATAQRNLDRSELTLPFAARVATHSVEVGQFLSAGHTAATLDSVDAAEVEVQLPMQTLRSLLRPDLSQGPGLPMDPTQMGVVLRDRGLSAEVRLRLGEEQVTWPAAVDRISATRSTNDREQSASSSVWTAPMVKAAMACVHPLQKACSSTSR
ncbi:Tetracycline repressor protein class A [Nymphon striatum]|nr:Tetracycline repressor protein class A [Nymphon striatum]